MQSLATFFEDNKPLAYAATVAAIIVLIAVVYILYRLLFGRRLRTAVGGRARQPRLGIVDAYDLDRQRQLVLVRRDNVEHLIMIGGPTDVVIESAIVRTQAVPSARDKDSAGPVIGTLPAAPNGNGSTLPPSRRAPSAGPVSGPENRAFARHALPGARGGGARRAASAGRHRPRSAACVGGRAAACSSGAASEPPHASAASLAGDRNPAADAAATPDDRTGCECRHAADRAAGAAAASLVTATACRRDQAWPPAFRLDRSGRFPAERSRRSSTPLRRRRCSPARKRRRPYRDLPLRTAMRVPAPNLGSRPGTDPELRAAGDSPRPAKALDTLESLEEEMAKLLGRPAPRRED